MTVCFFAYSALAEFDEPKRSTFIMFGVLTIAVRIYHDRWGYGVYSGPIGTAVLTITVKWVRSQIGKCLLPAFLPKGRITKGRISKCWIRVIVRGVGGPGSSCLSALPNRKRRNGREGKVAH